MRLSAVVVHDGHGVDGRAAGHVLVHRDRGRDVGETRARVDVCKCMSSQVRIRTIQNS